MLQKRREEPKDDDKKKRKEKKKQQQRVALTSSRLRRMSRRNCWFSALQSRGESCQRGVRPSFSPCLSRKDGKERLAWEHAPKKKEHLTPTRVADKQKIELQPKKKEKIQAD
jgi:hypothetical protein